MKRHRTVHLAGLFAMFWLTAAAAPSGTSGPPITAYLGEQQIPPSAISQYYCHDLDYPVVRCFQDPQGLAADTAGPQARLAATAVIYVTIYGGPSYQAPYMQISADYDALASIGWNDKVSSFKARNFETGSFYTDWFHGGSADHFCCNETQPILGSWDNVYSSLYRT